MAETSRPTTHTDPVYVVDGVTHYCVANMPGAVPITSTKALTNVTLPYVEAIAGLGLAEAVARDPALARGVNALGGRVTYEAVAGALGGLGAGEIFTTAQVSVAASATTHGMKTARPRRPRIVSTAS